MYRPRIQRSIDVVLDQAEAAVARQDGDGVADAARRVLAIDTANEDAAAFCVWRWQT